MMSAELIIYPEKDKRNEFEVAANQEIIKRRSKE